MIGVEHDSEIWQWSGTSAWLCWVSKVWFGAEPDSTEDSHSPQTWGSATFPEDLRQNKQLSSSPSFPQKLPTEGMCARSAYWSCVELCDTFVISLSYLLSELSHTCQLDGASLGCGARCKFLISWVHSRPFPKEHTSMLHTQWHILHMHRIVKHN